MQVKVGFGRKAIRRRGGVRAAAACARALAAACTGLVLAGGALAQSGTAGQASGGIYTCVDASGRRLTSDRPIASCLDREQRELNRTGTTKRVIGPSLTATEREQLEAKQRAQSAAQSQVREQERRERALAARYPDQASHDAVRADSMGQANAVIATAHARLQELDKERLAIADEMEFYKKDPSKVPGVLKRRQETYVENVASQYKVIATQEAEKGRINERFDAELQTLRRLWAGKPSR